MAFDTPLPQTAQLQIGGTWTDVTADVRGVGGTGAINIQRGITSSGGMVADRGTCALTLDNNTGKYSSRNPRSPYFGLIGRNTPIRVGAKYGTPWLDLPQGSLVVASTPDASILDIAGDIDIRVDAELPLWGDTTDASYVDLIAKYGTLASGQRSWFLGVSNSGLLDLFWSVDGTNLLGAESTAPVPFGPGQRGCVRVTLDVNNGASGRSVTFYTADSMAGPWTQLGSTVVQAGTTSIFNSSSPVEVGRFTGSPGDPLARKIYAAQVRNGIGGTVVASPNFEAQTVGATSFADTAPSPRTWTVTAGGISNTYTRFSGVVSSWPPQWDTGGFDVTTPISAAGILQRLGQGQPTLQSTLQRRIPSDPNLVAYWPMEDGAGATQAYSPIPGVQPMRTAGMDYGSDDSLPGSDALPTVTSPANISGTCPGGATAGAWRVEFVYKIPTAITSSSNWIHFASGGTVRTWRFMLDNGKVEVQGVDADGSIIVDSTLSPIDNALLYGEWARQQFTLSQSGGTVTWSVTWLGIGTTSGGAAGGTYTGTAGTCTGVNSVFSTQTVGASIGHIAVFDSAVSTIFDNADTGFAGERATTRLSRLSMEEATPVSIAAHIADTEQLGPQPHDTFLAAVTAAAAADEGLLYEARETPALRYRGRVSLYNQPSSLDLPYTAAAQPLMAPLTPVDDDQLTRNDSTVSRDGGSSGRYTADTASPLSPANVGLYSESVSLNLYSDDRLEQHAAWRVHLGTWDEARFPTVTIDLAKDPSLIPAVSRIDTGSRIRITGTLPDWLPPEAIDLMVLGYSESVGQFSWTISFACVPYGPYRVGVLDDPVLGRLDTAGSQLASAVSSSATSWSVTTTSGPRWVDSAGHPTEFPFDWLVAGERVTVTAISGTGTTQTATVARSVNGISKAQPTGTDVRLADPTIIAL